MKRWMCLLLAVSLLAAMLSGCGSTAASSGEPESAAVPASAEASAAEPEAENTESAPPESVEEPSESAMESEQDAYEKLHYALPLFPETREMSLWYIRRDTSGINPPYKDDPEYVFWAKLQQELNVDITFNEPSESTADTNYNLMIASGDMTDVICEFILADEASAYVGGYDKAIADEVYVDLLDYLDYAPNYAHYAMGDPDIHKAVLTDEGHLPGFFAIRSEPTLASQGLCVNKNLMDATGLPMPETVSDWLAVFAAMKEGGVTYPCDVTSEGEIMNGAFANAIGACLDCKFLLDAETEELVFGPTTDETRQYLEVFTDCFGKGYIDPDWTIDYGFLNPYFVSWQIPTTNAMAKDIPYYPEYIGLSIEPCPVVHREGYGAGQLAIGDYVSSLTRTGGAMCVTTACEDLETVMTVLDWAYSDEGAEICNYGWTEGETYTVENGKKYITAFMQEQSDYGFGNKTFYTSDQDFGLIFPNVEFDVADEETKKAYDGWTVDESHPAAIYLNLPGAARLTSQEATEVATLEADLSTYVESTLMKWMGGVDQLNDETWNAFVETCNSMQLETVQAAYDAAFHRYLES